MEFLLGIIIGAVSTYLVGYLVMKSIERRVESQLAALLEEMADRAQQTINARVEEHQGVFYVYNTKDNMFMAQGSTLAEIRATIEARWKEFRVYLTEGDDATIQALKKTGSGLETQND